MIMKWTEERLQQLEDLEVLLYTAQSLNNANNIIGNITKLINLSGKLLKYPNNFTNFLSDLAIEDRKNLNNVE